MYEYAPWATNVLKRILSISSKSLPILDLQFGGACNLNCIYCDTPKYKYPCLLDLEAIEKIISNGNIQWVYACGLGEPTVKGSNGYAFKKVLAMCKANSVKISVFSNIVDLDDELLQYIDGGTLHVLFKLDSFEPDVMSYLYGVDRSETILQNYEKLKEVIHIKNGTTNLGASIVLNAKNRKELCKIINFCMEYGIYPLLGQLENAGKCASIFDELKVDDNELLALRQYIKDKYGVYYQMPICPATISGIHITNTNKVIVDERTGLSCGWFWLDEPKMIEIGNIIDMSAEEITSKIMAYRKAKLADVICIEKSLKTNPFGGCGGDAKTLLQQYIKLSRRCSYEDD